MKPLIQKRDLLNKFRNSIIHKSCYFKFDLEYIKNIIQEIHQFFIDFIEIDSFFKDLKEFILD